MSFRLFQVISFALIGLTSTAIVDAAELPNIVWIVTEDNSPHWLRLYSDQGVAMPNVERLAEQGLVFEHAFSNAPVCSVARSTIISGCYAPRVGAQYHRREEFVPLPGDLKMFPHYLREAGYYTTNNNKEDYNFIRTKTAWDESSKKATYRNRKPGQPFFHVQNFTTTHEGQLHFPRSDVEQKPTETDPESVELFPYHPDTPEFRYTYARELDNHRKVDLQIGEFLKQLEADGLMEETIIFYYGDHGGVLPRSKGYAYESGLQVPMVVYAPQRWQSLMPADPGTRVNGFVSFVDLAPTVLHLAGVDVPEEMDGKAFLGEGIRLEELNRRATAFGYADRFDEKYDLVRTWRQGNFKYVRSFQPFNIDALYNQYRYRMVAFAQWRELYQAGELNQDQRQFFEPRAAEALYDLRSDPHELNNVAGDPAYAEVLTQLRGELNEQLKTMPDLSFYPEPYFLEAAAEQPVEFGRSHQDEIIRLINVANLSLLPFDAARSQIEQALQSDNPWVRYWGLIVCSSFADKAAVFHETATEIAKQDENNLVRVRAIEFLALNGVIDPEPLLLETLRAAKSQPEANLILNTAVLLQDGDPGYSISIPEDLFDESWPENGRYVADRMKYLNAD